MRQAYPPGYNAVPRDFIPTQRAVTAPRWSSTRRSGQCPQWAQAKDIPAAAAVSALGGTTPRETDFETIRPTWTKLQFAQAMKA